MKREVLWTAHPRIDVEYVKQPREYNTQTKREFWDACSEEGKQFIRELVAAFDTAEWEKI